MLIHESVPSNISCKSFKIINAKFLLWSQLTKWLAHLRFTSKVQVSVITFSMQLKPSPHVKRVKVNALPKVVGFLRVLGFPPTGKVDRVGLVKGPTVIGKCCCGDPVLHT